ncbi:ABC transporter permease [Mogibacterium neglectum]|uniref:ABC transporter permease n=1 Tax=Mogibacterium neglectum TaxID=114528 RepID=UPI00272C297B|nr:ABC transporter permease [Mogibacterium neglectum]WLD75708.1 ABC transporter permease [Mogibacterium neglectum]
MKKLDCYKILMSYDALLILITIFLILVMSCLSPYFLTMTNFKNVLNQSSLFIFLVIGMTFIIISGNIDLSVGATIGFTGMVMSNLYYVGIPDWLCIFAGLITGLLIGLINGWLVAYVKINSFIVTLCSMTVLRGVILLVMNSKTLYGFGKLYGFIGAGDIGPINFPILLALITVVISGFILAETKYGNYCLFLGANEVALSRMGVNSKKYKLWVFAFSGLLAAVAGVVVMGRLDSAEPLAGTGYEMDAIAAVILGGTVLEGGKGNIIGPFIACLILNIISDGLTLLSISSHYQEIITGVIIVVSVLISSRDKIKRREV